MLTIQGERNRYCDGVSRRNFLKLGALGFGGLTLADLLRAESAAGITGSHKGLINIHLGGGPSHQDMFDLKPEAPVEYRGEFRPIATNVPGLEICELFPELAKMADKFAVIRALVGSNAGHSNFQTHTGYNQKSLEGVGGRPSIGAVVAKAQGPGQGGVPAFISSNGGSPGYLGARFQPYTPGDKNMSLSLDASLTADRLDSRSGLLKSLDTIRRDVDTRGQMDAFDTFTQTAIDVVTSGRLAGALDMKKEDPEVLAKYGKGGTEVLRAKRLIEAGVRVVTLSAFGGWDTHNANFTTLRRNLPQIDQAMTALLWDLDRSGMLDDVSIVMWGEFGRTPRVNMNAGRDHWPQVAMAFLAGGGMRTGQAIGATTRYAEGPLARPVDFQEVHATLYHNLGLDPRTTQFTDPAGRPQYLLDKREPIAELV